MSINKSFSTETSERYSRALFEVTSEADELESVENNVKNFQALFESNSEKENAIASRSFFLSSAFSRLPAR